jgi:hypothetical protein
VFTPEVGFPVKASTYPIVLKIDDELMQATAFDGGSAFAVIRHYGGTTAAAHAASAVVQMQPYYRTFNRYRALPFAVLNLP